MQENFRRHDLLDDQVTFLKGWFRDILPALKHSTWSVVRLDGDMYESTWDGLINLYPNLSPGGYIIIDDYGAVPACKEAVEDYRRENGINDPIYSVDWGRAFWQKSK